MPKYAVPVEKRQYSLGEIEVEANSPVEAVSIVESMISRGEIQSTQVDWQPSEYEDGTFETQQDAEYETYEVEEEEDDA